MKISELWLREWVAPTASAEEWALKFHLAGLECEAAPLLADALDRVVVGRIVSAQKHPQADRLQVCQVDVGDGQPRQIVCGAPNARAGMNAPCALPGARMPGGLEIKQAQLRGVDSGGMLCSAKELALSDKSEGLLELDAAAKPGQPISDYLRLDDHLLTFELTPNRGDCLSVAGLARETAALYGLPARGPAMKPATVALGDRLDVAIENAADCPVYAGRAIAGINPKARTPDWMSERLRRSGLRGIHPVVDITNYVMLELGQPMHAFDRAKLQGGIKVRRARQGETLKLLNDQDVTLGDELLITDGSGPVALAGVMGGTGTAVSDATTSIFFESACFAPAAVSGAGRKHKLPSDALYRFERGVDPALQRRALERATELTLAICGGQAGPVSVAGSEQPASMPIRLRHAQVGKLLGQVIAPAEVEALLKRLGVALARAGEGQWDCTPPSWRYDLSIEADLIEEVARLYGYERIPARAYAAELAPEPAPEAQRPLAQLRQRLVARGYQEAVTYAFADVKLQARLTPAFHGIALDNPMADTMGVMRTTLWSGLIPAWMYNRQRQHPRVRLFEIGVVFEENTGGIVETQRLAGLAAGGALPEQWGAPARALDFYDVKADLEALPGADAPDYRFVPGEHPALHPGRTARVLKSGEPLGWLGQLHPSLSRELELPEAPWLFELDAAPLRAARLPRAQAPSEFPASRRDLALVVPETVSAQSLLDAARTAGGARLARAFVFDLFRGAALGPGFKSLALGLIFQEYSRTLTEAEIEASMQAVLARLQEEFGAKPRT